MHILCMVYYCVVYMLHHTIHMRYLYSNLLFLQKKGIPHLLLLLNPPLLIQPLDPPNPPDTDNMIVKENTLSSIVGKRSHSVYKSNRMFVIPKSGPHLITYQEYIHCSTIIHFPKILYSPHQTTPPLIRTTPSHVLEKHCYFS